MTIAIAQTSSTLTVISGTSGTISITPSSGNLMVAAMTIYTTTAITLAVTDNQNNNWTNNVSLKDPSSSNGTAYIASEANVAGAATTVTVTASSSSTFEACIIEVSGCATANPCVATDSHSTTSGSSNTASSVAGLAATAPCIAVVCGSCATMSTGSPYWIVGNNYSSFGAFRSSGKYSFAEYQIFTSNITAEHGLLSANEETTGLTAVIAVFAAVGLTSGVPYWVWMQQGD